MTRDNKAFTLWLTGLPGAGKTTLAHAVAEDLRRRGRDVEILDGDEVRLHLSKGLGFSKQDRDTNIARIGYVARLLSRNGVIVIAAAVSPYREARDQVRHTHEAPFVEVYVDCPVEELVKRDSKGLYRKALLGEIKNFTGISDPYESPLSPEVHVHSDSETVAETTTKILAALEERQLLTRTRGRRFVVR